MNLNVPKETETVYTVCQADDNTLGNPLLCSFQTVHCQNRRWQVDAEGALPFEAVALHGAV